MSENSKKSSGKKIILPPRSKTPSYKRSDVVVLPDLQSMLEDASSVISTELAKYKRRSEISTAGMDPETARVFQGYVKAAIDLSKEARERDKEFSDADVSDKELLDSFLDSMPQEDIVRLLQDKINSKTNKEPTNE